jgi:hypothetical protein
MKAVPQIENWNAWVCFGAAETKPRRECEVPIGIALV